MTFAGQFTSPEPFGILYSKGPQGWVLDASGPFAFSTDLPLYAFCGRCEEPVLARYFRADELPLAKLPVVPRCSKGHRATLPAYFTIFDNTPRMEPRMLHVLRASMPELIGPSWLTKSQADSLLAATEALLSDITDEKARRTFDRAAAKVPLLRRMVRSGEPWTRADRIAIAGVLVPIAIAAAQLAGDLVASDHLAHLLEQQQQTIEHQRDLIDRQHEILQRLIDPDR